MTALVVPCEKKEKQQIVLPCHFILHMHSNVDLLKIEGRIEMHLCLAITWEKRKGYHKTMYSSASKYLCSLFFQRRNTLFFDSPWSLRVHLWDSLYHWPWLLWICTCALSLYLHQVLYDFSFHQRRRYIYLHLILNMFICFHLCVCIYICIPAWVYTHQVYARAGICLLEVGISLSGNKGRGYCKSLNMGTGSLICVVFAKAPSTINHWSISLDPVS